MVKYNSKCGSQIVWFMTLVERNNYWEKTNTEFERANELKLDSSESPIVQYIDWMRGNFLLMVTWLKNQAKEKSALNLNRLFELAVERNVLQNEIVEAKTGEILKSSEIIWITERRENWTITTICRNSENKSS